MVGRTKHFCDFKRAFNVVCNEIVSPISRYALYIVFVGNDFSNKSILYFWKIGENSTSMIGKHRLLTDITFRLVAFVLLLLGFMTIYTHFQGLCLRISFATSLAKTRITPVIKKSTIVTPTSPRFHVSYVHLWSCYGVKMIRLAAMMQINNVFGLIVYILFT